MFHKLLRKVQSTRLPIKPSHRELEQGSGSNHGNISIQYVVATV